MPYNVTGSSAFQAANSTDFESNFKLAWYNIHALNASGALLCANQPSQGPPVMSISPMFRNVTYDPKSCTQAGKECPCSMMNNTAVPDDTFMKFFMSVTPNATQMVLDYFGNSDRVAAIIQDWKNMKSAPADIYMVTTSWADLTPTAWGNFVFTVLGMAGGDTMTTLMPLTNILTLAAANGTANKGPCINSTMRKYNPLLTPHEAVFADDSWKNINSAMDVCDTLWVQPAEGLQSGTSLAYLDARALFLPTPGATVMTQTVVFDIAIDTGNRGSDNYKAVQCAYGTAIKIGACTNSTFTLLTGYSLELSNTSRRSTSVIFTTGIAAGYSQADLQGTIALAKSLTPDILQRTYSQVQGQFPAASKNISVVSTDPPIVTTDNSTPAGGLTTGAVVGIIFAVLVGLAIVGAAIFFVTKPPEKPAAGDYTNVDSMSR